MRRTHGSIAFSALLLTLVSAAIAGCSGRYEKTVRRDLSSYAKRWKHTSQRRQEGVVRNFDKGLPAYTAFAMQHSPKLRASFERWRASVRRVSKTRKLPEPTLRFGYFIRSVETAVGPQQARIGLEQSFPWPTKLTRGADAASAQALAMQKRFDAEALLIASRVSHAYWNLWEIRQTRATHAEHLEVLYSLSQSVNARVATGAIHLADQQQVDLTASRLEDMLQGITEEEQRAMADLCAVLGLPAVPKEGGPSQGEQKKSLSSLPTPGDAPAAQLPADSPSSLAKSVRSHPAIASLGVMAEAHDHEAGAEAAERLPSFTVGVDWIVTGSTGTGNTTTPGTQDSGKDAVIVGAGIRVPLWQGSYADSVEAAEAEARATRAEQQDAINRALAELASSLSAVRDAIRRVKLHRDTLVPQADFAYESVLGAYTAGRGSIAQILLAQRDLLELRVELDKARAAYARSWAHLEQVVGHPLGRPASTEASETPNASVEPDQPDQDAPKVGHNHAG